MEREEFLLSRFVGFASLGILTTTQELAARLLEVIPRADPASVAEETFSLVAVTSARAAEVGFGDRAELGHAASMLLASLPMSHREYLIGGAVLADAGASPLTEDGQLAKRIGFYATHFPENAFPGPIALNEKLGLWMGRVSIPGLPTTPEQRLDQIDAVDTLHLHLRLLLGFARQLVS